MATRRSCLVTLLGGAVFGASADAGTLGEVLKVGPKPKLIPGKPAKVDFGHGLLVPMNRDAFEALWEGDDRWITYGHGFGYDEARAMGQAEEAAIGTMKLYLLTLVFAPERLERVAGGGWRLKSGKIDDLVRGDVYLPGRPVMPTTDQMYGYFANESGRGEGNVHATTGWLIWKKDVTLDYVRINAKLVAAGG